MKMRFTLCLLYCILSGLIALGQCDSVVVLFDQASGESGKRTRTITRYDTAGNILSKEVYENDYPDYVWKIYSRNLYTYDSNNNLLSDTGFHAQSQLFGYASLKIWEYNSNSNPTVNNYFLWQNHSWKLWVSDSMFYDAQNNLINHTFRNNYDTVRDLHYYNAVNLDTMQVNQTGDNQSNWTNQSRIDKYYNADQTISFEVEFEWEISSWDSAEKRFYFYSNGLLDSMISQILDTTWKNNKKEEFEYGALNKLTHHYFLSWADTGWIYLTRIITDVDANGYPSYKDEQMASYYNGTLTWHTLYGSYYTTYNSDGQLISYSGHATPGGPYSGTYYYQNGIPTGYFTESETMGGFYTAHNGSYAYADIIGNTAVCPGDHIVLSTDSCPGRTYLWSNGATTPSITVTTPGNYHVQVTNPSGFITQSHTIEVTSTNLYPYLANGPDSILEVCDNRLYHLVVPAQQGVIYQWYRNDTAIYNYGYSSLPLSQQNLANAYFYVTATSPCGIDTSATTTVSIIPSPPAPTITPPAPWQFCEGDSIQLTSSPGDAYYWPQLDDSSQSVYITNNGTYEVRVFDVTGCYSSVTAQVFEINYPANVDIYIEYNQLRATPSNCSWFVNGDTIHGVTGTLVPTIPGYYYVIAGNQPCTLSSDSIYIDPGQLNVDIPPVVHACINGSKTIGAILPVISGTPPYQYHWSPNVNLVNNGDGTAAISNLTANTTYHLSVTDALGLTATDSVEVIVHQPVIPEIIPTKMCAPGGFATLESNGINYTIQSWILNGDTISSTSSSYQLNSGIFGAIATDEFGCQVTAGPDTIIQHPSPNLPLINLLPDSASCITGIGTLYVHPEPGATYRWQQSPTYQQISTDTLVHTSYPSIYRVIVTDSNGCTRNSTFQFGITQQTFEFQIVSSGTFCDSVVLQAPQIDGCSYTWYYNNNLLSVTADTLSASLPGQYVCEIISPDGCTGSSGLNLNYGTQPPVNISFDGNQLIANCDPNVNYQWFFNGLEIPGATDYTYTPIDSGSYTVRVLKWPGLGNHCPSYSNPVHFPVCSADILTSGSIVCSGNCDGELTATAFGQGPLNFSWSNGSGSQTISGLCPGTFIVTVSDSMGCSATDTAIVTENNLSSTISITGAGCAGCSDGTAQVNVQSGIPPFTYSIQPPAGSISGNIFSNLPPGIYQFCVTDSLNCTFCITDTVGDQPVSIDEEYLESLKYYPNPVKNRMTLEGLTDAPSSFTATIYDEKGALVRKLRLDSNELETGFLSPGRYTLVLTNSDRTFNLKFLKE